MIAKIVQNFLGTVKKIDYVLKNRRFQRKVKYIMIYL